MYVRMTRQEIWILVGLIILQVLLLLLLKLVSGKEGILTFRKSSKKKKSSKKPAAPKPAAPKPAAPKTYSSSQSRSGVMVGGVYIVSSSNRPPCAPGNKACKDLQKMNSAFNMVNCKTPPFQLKCPSNFCMKQKDVNKIKKYFPDKDPLKDRVTYGELYPKLLATLNRNKLKPAYDECEGTCRQGRIPSNYRTQMAPSGYQWITQGKCVAPSDWWTELFNKYTVYWTHNHLFIMTRGGEALHGLIECLFGRCHLHGGFSIATFEPPAQDVVMIRGAA